MAYTNVMGSGLVKKPAAAVVFPTTKPAPTPVAQTVRQAVLPPAQNSYTVPVPNNIPSTALSAGVTKTDVQAKRDAMEKAQTAKLTSEQTFQQGLAGIQANPQSTDFISSLMFPQVTPTTQARDILVTEQQGLLSKARDFITGRNRDSAGELTKMQEEAGLPQLQERISVSNERIAQLKGELSKVRPQIEGEAGQTRIGAEARLSPIERNLNAEIASEALVQAALVGNATMVQNNIDKIMELEFKDEQAQLNDMMLGIQMVGQEIQTLDPKLQEEATQRLQQFQFAVQERATALQTAQQNKAGVLQVLSQAAQNGAPQQVLDAIKSAQTPEQAMAVTGGYMTDPKIAIDRERLNLEYAKLARDQSEKALEAQLAQNKAGKAVQLQFTKANRIIDQVDAVLPKVGWQTAGVAGLFSFVPGSVQKDLQTEINSIKANIGFNELQEMRNASPTGGALGQVAVQELDFLQSTLGSLDSKQSPGQLRENLMQVKSHFQNWKAITEAEQTGTITLVNKDGVAGVIPADQLEEALNEGYTLP
jgi:hypothetical protein